MTFIEILGEDVIYVNQLPQLRSRHGKFPGLVQLKSG
jgi:hypothetical protein